jgi:hypothetical protein|tara:strand:- start:2792 stop:3337 length:546 start_codon:yes stop_codon:yes gene_type:complete
MGTIKDIKYKIIKNFLTKEEVSLLLDYCIIKHRFNFENFDDKNKNCDSFFYADPLMESLLKNKKEKMEEATNLKLLPTYSFWRMYTKLSDLPKHKDRESCEISVTIQIGSDGSNWPIYMNGKPITLEQGDAVIYLGMELEHYRNELEGSWHAQAFLHYVDKDGPNKEWYLDKRRTLGHIIN